MNVRWKVYGTALAATAAPVPLALRPMTLINSLMSMNVSSTRW